MLHFFFFCLLLLLAFLSLHRSDRGGGGQVHYGSNDEECDGRSKELRASSWNVRHHSERDNIRAVRVRVSHWHSDAGAAEKNNFGKKCYSSFCPILLTFDTPFISVTFGWTIFCFQYCRSIFFFYF
jgi:hypothetical protein